MHKLRKLPLLLVIVWGWLITVSALAAVPAAYGESGKKTVRKAADPYARELTRKGDTVIISKQFVDLVKKNNAIILSKITVRQRLDESGTIAGYELVEVERGSVVEKMGFKPGDRVLSVNGIPVRDLEANLESLETAGRHVVTILRKGRARNLVFEIR